MKVIAGCANRTLVRIRFTGPNNSYEMIGKLRVHSRDIVLRHMAANAVRRPRWTNRMGLAGAVRFASAGAVTT